MLVSLQRSNTNDIDHKQTHERVDTWFHGSNKIRYSKKNKLEVRRYYKKKGN